MENRGKTRTYFHKRSRNEMLTDSLTRQMYQLIVRQLHHDGYLGTASAISRATGTIVPDINCDGDRLKRIITNGIARESISNSARQNFDAVNVVERHLDTSKIYMPLNVSDYSLSDRCMRVEQAFSTSALDGVPRHISFSPNGSLVSCAGTNGLSLIMSLDTLEKLSAVDNLKASMGASDAVGRSENDITDFSIARQYTDHAQSSVEVMRFHPIEPFVLTGGFDRKIFLRNYSSPDTQRELLQYQDSFPIRCASFHPAGEYVLFGTDNPTPRMMNLTTEKVFKTSAGMRTDETQLNPHSASLTDVAFSPDGRTLASSSLDGSWIVYDGNSGKSIYRCENAHSKVPVTSVLYSRTGNILLTSGMDAVPRLWDLRYLPTHTGLGGAATEVMSFGEPGKCNHRSMKAVFSFDESHILCQDASLEAVHSFCVFTGNISSTFTTKPAFMQRSLACNGTSQLIVTGADDSRLRLWTNVWRANR